jgi:hypothetical protein
VSGLVLTIDGLEYALGTSGVTSMPTSSDASWPDDATILTGALEWPRTKITERARLLDGDVDVSSQTFRVFDLFPTSGSASGRNWVTYLLTRAVGQITQTVLTVSLTSSATTVTVDSTTGFASSGTIWIDQEAITYSGTTATTFTGCTRGVLGTVAVAHALDTATGDAPFVFASIPSIEALRCILWLVIEGEATPLYIGTVGEAPVLSGGNGPEGGAVWEIGTDAIWRREQNMRPGIQATLVTPVGFNAAAIVPGLHYPGAGEFLSFAMSPIAEDSIKSTLEQAMQKAQDHMRNRLADESINATPSIRRVDANGVGLEVVARVSSAIDVSLQIGQESAFATSREGSDPRSAVAKVRPVPSTLVYLPADGASTKYLLDSIAGLPSTWNASGFPYDDAPHSTGLQYLLLGEIDADTRLVLEPSATAAGTATLAPSVTATNRVIARDSGQTIANYRWLDHAVNLRLCGKVTTNHWLRGLQRAVCVRSDVLDSGVDERNWDFAHADEIVSATSAGPCDRTWYLDGSRTMRELVSEACAFNGIGLGVRSGRTSPFVIRPPMATDAVAATFTAGSYTEKTGWQRNPDGVATSIKIEGGPVAIRVNDRMATRRFGQQRTIAVTLPESDDPRILRPTPRDLYYYAFGRVLSLWNQPTFVRTLHVGLEYATGVWIGDYVSVTDWLTPDGTGARGPSGVICQVIGRTVDLSPGKNQGVTLEVLTYWQGTLHGYAPAIRIDNIAGAVVTAATAWHAGTSTLGDFSGSDLASYTKTANDGGAGWFRAGDKVKIVRRNVTSVTEETGLEVLSVSGAAITLTSSPVTVVAAPSAEYDLVFDDYGNGSATTDNMEDFAWVGSYSTRVIGTSTDAARKWAP